MVLLLAAQVLWERRYAATGRNPLFVPALMRSPGFVAGNVVALLWFGAVVAHIGIVTIFLLQGEGLSPLLVAAVLVPSAAARPAASGFSSRLFAWLGPASVTIGLASQVLALAALCLATLWFSGDTLVAVIVVTEVAAGLTAGLVEPPLRAITLGFAADAFRGVAASFLQLTQRLSATFCVAIATGLILGTTGAPPTTVDLRAGLLVCLALLIGATVVSRSRLEAAHRQRAQPAPLPAEGRVTYRAPPAGASAPSPSGSECLDHIAELENLLEAETTSSSFTDAYSQVKAEQETSAQNWDGTR
ncbi:MAG: Transporter [Cryobacterium sp.]|nr:Transporter [Cryobacterium sp.]